jgi:xanthine dehydrogenase YagR molybdenum-binding subunit
MGYGKTTAVKDFLNSRKDLTYAWFSLSSGEDDEQWMWYKFSQALSEINPKLAESQCYGGIIMGISTALCEERIMDQATGRHINTGFDTYKLPGIGDIGEIVVHLDIAPEHDKRGVIGLGEPPAIGIQAAIGNAVANAIGVRVSSVPMTPDRVLAALEGRNA